MPLFGYLKGVGLYKIDRIQLNNFKSIREMDLELKDINILIGANGVGKSNLISYFTLLNRIIQKQLRDYVGKKGGVETFLYFGQKKSPMLFSSIVFQEGHKHYNEYDFNLAPNSVDDNFVFANESAKYYLRNGKPRPNLDLEIGRAHV